MCKVHGCPEGHSKHYCKVCGNYNSTHFSKDCPEGTIVYHGTKKEYAQSIKQNGFMISNQGRIGAGVYFTLDYSHAKKIALYKFKNSSPVVIQCRAKVNYSNQFTREDNEEKLLQKLGGWFTFCQDTAKQANHPPWANNQQFREVCVKDPDSISIIKVHDV